MPNLIRDNTYIITDSSATALTWPSRPAINNLILYALNTNAAATFLLAAGTPIFQFNIITHGAVSVGSSASTMPTTYVFDLNATVFPTAWIPTTLTACTAWINFA